MLGPLLATGGRALHRHSACPGKAAIRAVRLRATKTTNVLTELCTEPWGQEWKEGEGRVVLLGKDVPLLTVTRRMKDGEFW